MTDTPGAERPTPRWRVKDESGEDLIALWKRRGYHTDEYAAAEIIEELERQRDALVEQLKAADVVLAQDVAKISALERRIATDTTQFDELMAASLECGKRLAALTEAAKPQYDKHMEGLEEPDPVERLRFFCSIAFKNPQDWLDVEPFFDDIIARLEAAKRLAEALDTFKRALNIVDALTQGHRTRDDTPLRQVIPGTWPTLGDLRKVIREIDAARGGA